ncbi:hypothetical protein MMC15_005792 [Xylographa vitiligo]|nr:hypothetical protein [Xylographa vitiligo]
MLTATAADVVARSEGLNYIPSYQNRGTLDILWSCLFTLIACTWTIQHLNIPEQRGHRDPGWRGDLKWCLKDSWTNLKWMIGTMIAPEYILGKALGDLMRARRSKLSMEAFAHSDGVEWGLMHGFYANMGGFVLRGNESLQTTSSREGTPDIEGAVLPQHTLPNGTIPSEKGEFGAPLERSNMIVRQQGTEAEDITCLEGEDDSKDPDLDEPHSRSRRWGVSKLGPNHEIASKWLQSDGRRSRPCLTDSASQVECHDPWFLLAEDIFWLRDKGIVPKLPNITENELNDKSKGDLFVKLTAMAQIFWVVLQVIVRATRKLTISQLELAVTAFSACALVTYFLLLHKPKGVQTPITLIEYQQPIPVGQLPPELRRRALQGFIRGLFNPHEDIVEYAETMGKPIANDAFEPSKEIVYMHVGIGVSGAVFGGIHVAAWDFTFPTEVERDLWRLASVMSMTLLPILYSALLYNEFVRYIKYRLFIKIWNLTFGILYLAARIFLIMETFRSLFYLPPDAYISTWAQNLPHVAR